MYRFGLNFTPDAVILCLEHSPGFTQSYQEALIVVIASVVEGAGVTKKKNDSIMLHSNLFI